MVERIAETDQVVGSNPTWSTRFLMFSKKAKHIPTKESIEEILDLIGNEKCTVTGINNIEYIVNSESLRLRTFKNSGIVCAECGITATHWVLTFDQKLLKPHLNLMCGDILFTHDHIIPRSKGGKNYLSNTQTMCYPCNSKLGSKD